MIIIQGFIRTAPENAAKFKEAAAAVIAATRQEPGCISYCYGEDIAEPGLFHIAERWADDGAIAAHNKAPHFLAFSAALPAIGITGIRIARYDTDAEKVLFGV